MKKEDQDDFVSGTFTWKIDQFSNLNKKKYYSDVFDVGGFKWRIFIFPKGNNVEFLSMYLNAADFSTSTSGLSRYAKFSLTLVNQIHGKYSITKDTEHEFTAVEYNDWGYTQFMRLSDILDPARGYLVSNNVIVEAEVSVRKGDIKFLQKETGDLIDFRGLGRIELAFHPLLKEVCLSHPSLIECQQKRSSRFVECAFTALGRLLHFLKTRKGKDLNQDGYESLQLLWEELETGLQI